MTRLRRLALFLAALILVTPFEQDPAWAERSDTQYGRPSTVFKRGTTTRPRRKTRRHHAAPSAPAASPKPAGAAGAQTPPASPPIPQANPERPRPQAAPTPQAKPEGPGEPDDAASPPATAPLPVPKPPEPEPAEVKPPPPAESRTGADTETEPPEAGAGELAPPVQVPLHPEPTPAEELACRARLKDLGAEFADRPAQADPFGCSLPHPMLLTKLSRTIALKPGALVNCATAEAAARFAQGPMSDAAWTLIGEDLVSIDQASAYVCRPRHGTRKLSEHAFGNAVDFSRFTFSKGSVLDVGPTPGAKGESFLQAVRRAACGPFKTVLGPGSDADHATHLHLDLAHRRNGATFCQ